MEDESIDNDDVTLPSDTLAILQEFLKEKELREHAELELINRTETTNHQKNIEFEENWQLSQFWYNPKTISDLAHVCKLLVQNNTDRIGLVSCPSIYKSVKEVHTNVNLFEFDNRFLAYGSDFIFYDFNDCKAEAILELEGSFDIIVVDPPFLSEDCIEKISLIIQTISKEDAKILFCSGEVVEPWISKYLQLKKQKYIPEHQRNLGNEFASYSNFDLDALLQNHS